MTTQISRDNIQAATLGGFGGPKISSVQVTNSSYSTLNATAVDTAGGFIRITGSGFTTGCQVLVNTTPATSTTFISSTEVRAQVPATAAGTYVVYLVNSDGGVAIRVNGITFSALPAWVTASTLAPIDSNTPISVQLAANAATVYLLQNGSTLPSGLTLSSTGLLSGTTPVISNTTTFSFVVVAIDAELQDSPRTFSLSITAAPVIGQAFGGGFYAGQISTTGNGVATHNLIVGPLSTAQFTGQWRTTATATAGTTSVIDGPGNTAAMIAAGAALHPCGNFCNNLVAGGFDDWYMPARNELEVCYFNLKPTTANNETSTGSNLNAVPSRSSLYTLTNPARTSAAAFQSGGSEAFSGQYWTSTQGAAVGDGRDIEFTSGSQNSNGKYNNFKVRAVRRVPV